MEFAKERGASSWLVVLQISRHGFALHKSAFRDALCLCYGWHPPHLPAECLCGKSFTVEHAMSCKRGGFPILRHNEIWDFSAQLMDKVCTNVTIESELQTLTGE